jgi:DNA-binding protein YbaB
MPREIDEAWIDEAIERHRRLEDLRARFDKAAAELEVSVTSPDQVVEVVVNAAGTIVDVRFPGLLRQRTNAELARSVLLAVRAAGDAAQWAREKLHSELFGAYRPLGEG